VYKHRHHQNAWMARSILLQPEHSTATVALHPANNLHSISIRQPQADYHAYHRRKTRDRIQCKLLAHHVRSTNINSVQQLKNIWITKFLTTSHVRIKQAANITFVVGKCKLMCLLLLEVWQAFRHGSQ
jgi:hypothetical protein